ncbi:PQQ-binding-like beta-propeller repeat protein [Endozoicomonas arenosclerae]|uniref:outer membrane protein assembly factor BamB family protein n=1 Tax=Endozoicomonas arenosclerae TaxID=1633495 RepID=UPI000783F8E0|nr:PQQ-binding-like beta-propeller repeat protein [Endozoicomonas arenosclerae]
MKKKLLTLAVLMISTTAIASQTETKTYRSGVYADTEWPTAHGGSRNDDHIGSVKELPRSYEQSFEVLEGAGVLMGPSKGIDPKTGEAFFVVATALDKGNSNLTAFNKKGEILWSSEPWEDKNDFDTCGVIASPIIDSEGDIYVSDCNQMWSYHADGSVKWVQEIPEPVEGYDPVFDDLNLPVKPNVIGNAFFTKPKAGDESTAYVGGITIWGDVTIFDRETGKILDSQKNLPGDFEASMPVKPPFLWPEPYYAKGYNDLAWSYFQGGLESANVPAVHPETGIIYATGPSSKVPGSGAVHGFSVDPYSGKVEFVYEAVTGPKSGSSPTISGDLKYIFASDGEGTLFKYRVNYDEKPVWKNPTGLSRPISPSLGGVGDNKLYVFDDRKLYALSDETGDLVWEKGTHELAKKLLPYEPIASESTICSYNGFPNAITLAIPGQILMTAVLGYNWSPSGDCSSGSGLPVAVKQGVWALDPETGDYLRDGEMIPAEDTNEAFSYPTVDGLMFMDRGVLSSAMNEGFYDQMEAAFPEGFKPILPQGGVEVLEGKDDIKMTAAISGRVLFDESFAKEDSTLRLEGKGNKGKLELKGEAEGERDVTYKVNIKSNKNGRDVDGTIEVKKDKKTIHKIKIGKARFNDRSVEGFGVDKKTGKKVNFYVADWRSSGERGDK